MGFIAVVIFVKITKPVNRFFEYLFDLTNEYKRGKYLETRVRVKRKFIYYGIYLLIGWLGVLLYYTNKFLGIN